MGKGHWAKENWPKLTAVIIVALSVGIALYLRVCLPYDKVFSGDWIKFTGIDVYYHMRLVDNLVHNFPHYTAIDPYFIYPGATGEISLRFFGWFLASIIWVIGLGSPTQHTIDMVGAYFPAVLGALVVIPVYFIGKELFGRWAGVISAGLIAIIPGESLGRSILGFTDHDVANTLFTTVAILFLILAIKAARQREWSFSHLNRRDWAIATRPLIYSFAAGIFLGIYLLTWAGALLFVFLISVYFVIQFIIDHLKHKSTDYLCLVGVILFLAALLVFWAISPGRLYLASLIIAILIPLVLSGVSWLMTRRGIKPAYFPLALLGLGPAGLAIFYVVNPSLLKSMLGKFSVFTPTGASLTTVEMQSLLTPLVPGGDFFTTPAWGNFYIGFFLSLISIGILIYLVIKQGDAEKSLLVVWSLVILAMAIGQRRFASYLAINVALLTGYLSWRFLEFAGFKELAARAVKTAKEIGGTKARPKKGGFHITISQVNMALAVLIIFFVAFFPYIAPATATAKEARWAPSDAWVSSLSWLKENTPDPFDNPDAYYELHELPPPGESYSYPESAYGVLAWWDYGYWITHIAHRIPNANPSQNPAALANVAHFFTSQDENSANEIARELGAAYVILDYQTVTGKFHAVAQWADRSYEEFFDVYYLPKEGVLMPVQLFYPEYYHSLSSRLYNFDGKAVTPENTAVISYQERVSQEGVPYKQITSVERFDSYEDAEAYLLRQESANYKIVGDSPFISPVPLDALEHYRLIHGSDIWVILPTGGTVSVIKIFEYIE
jgi:dolichyl-diphosphooligosaccharide--protein glycosyltransferase